MQEKSQLEYLLRPALVAKTGTYDLYLCEECGQQEPYVRTFKICACELHFCTKECQTKSWESHKPACKAARAKNREKDMEKKEERKKK